MSKEFDIEYVNWLDDNTTIRLRSLREVATLDEIMDLKKLELVDEGKVFEMTITFFKRAFVDEVDRKAFFMEPMDTVLQVLDEWLVLSYKGNRKLGEDDTLDDDYEVSFDVTFIDETDDVKNYTGSVIGNVLLLLFLLAAVLFNWWWIVWGLVAAIGLNTVIFTGLLINALYKRHKNI